MNMTVFFLLIFIPILIQHIRIKGMDYNKKNKFCIVLFFVFLTILLMLRHKSVGTDTSTYMYLFKRMSFLEWSELSRYYSTEIGFSYYNKLVSLISDSPQFFLAMTALITIGMMIPTYKRLCIDSAFTIVLFCTMSTFVMMFSGIRQMLAVGIGFIAYECVRKRKILFFLLVVGIAMTIHTSAFMLIFMYPLYYMRITKKLLYIIVPSIIAIFAFNKPIFSVLSLFIERYTKYEGGIIETGAYSMIFVFTLFSIFAFLIPNESMVDEETMALRNFLLFSLVLQVFAPLHNLAMRMNYYYIIFIPLLLPRIVKYRNVRWKQVAIVGRHTMVIFFGIYFIMSAYKGGNLDVFPYHFFWENV